MTTLNSLRWHKFPVLDDGFICLVDAFGDEASILRAARVSYGRDNRDTDVSLTDTDRTLLRYLMRNRHSTPFEMAEMIFLVRAPIYVIRQWHRHRTFSYNEYSGRYSEMIDSMEKTAPEGWRLQSTANKQGSQIGDVQWPDGYSVHPTHYFNPNSLSYEVVGYKVNEDGDGREYIRREIDDYVDQCHDITASEYLSGREQQLQSQCRDVYEQRLKFGIAKEQARKDLPVSNYTEMYAKVDIANLMHFLSLRCDIHAQTEIRQYANIILNEFLKPLFPTVHQAFIDYRLESQQMTRLDQVACRLFTMYGRVGMGRSFAEDVLKAKADGEQLPVEWSKDRCRERDECVDKLVSLGIVSND